MDAVDECDHRPSGIPRPSSATHISHRTFDFATTSDKASSDNNNNNHPINAPSESCIGISLATVMNTFRGPLSTTSAAANPTSPSSHCREEDGSVFNPFHKVRTAIQKSLGCSTGKTYRSTNSVVDDWHTSFECDTFDHTCDRERSLMRRAASWGTQETSLGTLPSMDQRISTSNTNNRNVQFHYPPITSVRLRPRTHSDDIKQLFFAPEELDEIEDDRSDTRAADDIETLAVGADDWGCVPTTTSSIVTASDYDDQDSRSGLMLTGDGASNVMFDRSFSPRRRRDPGTGDKRFVRGVQIMLREKSTG